jgi:hypothetical protein
VKENHSFAVECGKHNVRAEKLSTPPEEKITIEPTENILTNSMTKEICKVAVGDDR